MNICPLILQIFGLVCLCLHGLDHRQFNETNRILPAGRPAYSLLPTYHTLTSSFCPTISNLLVQLTLLCPLYFHSLMDLIRHSRQIMDNCHKNQRTRDVQVDYKDVNQCKLLIIDLLKSRRIIVLLWKVKFRTLWSPNQLSD